MPGIGEVSNAFWRYSSATVTEGADLRLSPGSDFLPAQLLTVQPTDKTFNIWGCPEGSESTERQIRNTEAPLKLLAVITITSDSVQELEQFAYSWVSKRSPSGTNAKFLMTAHGVLDPLSLDSPSGWKCLFKVPLLSRDPLLQTLGVSKRHSAVPIS